MKFVRLIRLDTGADFLTYAVLVTNPDGSVSFGLPNGGFAGQEPGDYGKRHDQDPNTGAPQQYQRATLSGNIVTFVPLAPSTADPTFIPMGYLACIGQVY